jgi:AcrR family transcriptional regulator
MPKLWRDTIEAHRSEVRSTILDVTAAMVTEHGLHSVTMSQIADEAGIGRATLYKYFPDVGAILLAWHDRHVVGHLEQLTSIRDRPGAVGERLEAVLEAYALMTHARPRGTELAAFVHRGAHLDHSQRRLTDLIEDLLTEASQSGEVRDDIPPAELASYCLHALSAAGEMRSKAAVHRLVAVTLAGLCPPTARVRD